MMKNTYWAVKWISESKLDGRREFFLGDVLKTGAFGPRLFRTREAARQWRDDNYGYIRDRPDLQAEPHGWKLPHVKRVRIEISEVSSK